MTTDPNTLSAPVTIASREDLYAASDDNVKAWLNDEEIVIYGNGAKQIQSLCRRIVADQTEMQRLREWLKWMERFAETSRIRSGDYGEEKAFSDLARAVRAAEQGTSPDDFKVKVKS